MIKKLIDKLLYVRQWSILIGHSNELLPDISNFKCLMPPKDRFWADPFVIERDNKIYVFVEELIYFKRRGHISVLILDKNFNLLDVMPVIREPWHLSYPFLLEHDGKLFMIPESSANHTVTLYECVDFPGKWRKVVDLMTDIDLVDSTILFKDNKWWMFSGIANGMLNIYTSSQLISTAWLPHVNNPVIHGVSSSRPAGALFEYKGDYYRPSQDCAIRYGHSTNVNKVHNLSAEKYAEEMAGVIMPDVITDALGVHTLNRCGDIVVFDVFYHRKRFALEK